MLTATVKHPTSPMNAVDALLHHEFGELFRLLKREREARVIVLTGEGKAFSAGGDFGWFPALRDTAALDALLADLSSMGARRLVIEGRGRSQDQVDVRRAALAQRTDRTVRSMEYDHMKPVEEPLLWIADAAAWAYGAAGDWRRRADPMIDDVTKLG